MISARLPITRVLIVEDDAQACHALQFFLRLRGYHVQEVRTGEEAISEFCRFEPEALVVPSRLPDIPLFDLLRKLVQFPHYSARLTVLILDDAPHEGEPDDSYDALACHWLSAHDLAAIERILVAANQEVPLPKRFVRLRPLGPLPYPAPSPSL